MFYIKKTFELSCSHQLNLPYQSKCNNLHGHNYIVTVYCESNFLDENGMVVDFSEIKHQIVDKLDHKNLNDVLLSKNPTAENIAEWICKNVDKCKKVKVQESSGNIAIFELE